MALLECPNEDAVGRLVVEAAKVASKCILTDDIFFHQMIGKVLRTIASEGEVSPPTDSELDDIRQKLNCVVQVGSDKHTYMQCVRDENEILVNDEVRHL